MFKHLLIATVLSTSTVYAATTTKTTKKTTTTTTASIAAEKITLDPATSKVTYVGKKVTGSHTGEVKIQSGHLNFSEDTFTGAEVVIDMTTINNTDLTDKEYNKKFVDHMNSDDFFATGVSIVMHPVNPFVPIIHMNIRYFEMDEQTRWFGGGIDLTPHYVIDTDARYFHHLLKQTCDAFDASFYPKFKAHADDYFFIKHREETRGVGGIFYDRLKPENTGLSYEHLLDFSAAISRTFLPVYTELIDRNRDKEFTPEHQEWQYLRRSRYAEFNLVYDAGTKFGLETNGRIESILMSLPPMAKWIYNHQPALGSEEHATLSKLKKGIEWV